MKRKYPKFRVAWSYGIGGFTTQRKSTWKYIIDSPWGRWVQKIMAQHTDVLLTSVEPEMTSLLLIKSAILILHPPSALVLLYTWPMIQVMWLLIYVLLQFQRLYKANGSCLVKGSPVLITQNEKLVSPAAVSLTRSCSLPSPHLPQTPQLRQAVVCNGHHRCGH